jgi:CheY-like chemotaxis protein
MKILIADDEPAVLKMLALLLERQGHEVMTAANGKQALELLVGGSFDCVITDAIMPVMTGFELTQAVRKDPVIGQIPILMLTRKRHRVDVRQALDAGVTDYLLKPVDEHLLLDKLDMTLKKTTGSRQFYETTLQAAAELLVRSEIVALSESGATLNVPMQLPRDLESSARTSIFEEIGIRAPLMRLVSCEPLAAARSGLTHEAKFSFVALAEPELMKIRSWLQKEAIRRRK